MCSVARVGRASPSAHPVGRQPTPWTCPSAHSHACPPLARRRRPPRRAVHGDRPFRRIALCSSVALAAGVVPLTPPAGAMAATPPSPPLPASPSAAPPPLSPPPAAAAAGGRRVVEAGGCRRPPP